MKQGRAEILYAKQCDNYDLISFISKTIFEIKYQEKDCGFKKTLLGIINQYDH